MISLKELHSRTLPPEKKKAVKIDFVSYYLWRPLCDRISILLMSTNLTPTVVTIFSFYMALLSLVIFLFIPGKIGALIGYFLLWLWNISDGIDGNIARYKKQYSKAGDLWDATAGYMAMVAFYFGAGMVASNERSIFFDGFISSHYYVALGALAAIWTIFPRLIVQKKNVSYGIEAVKKLKDKSNYDWKMVTILNLNSINGLAGLLLLISIIWDLTNIFVFSYFVIQSIFFIASMIVTMRDL